MAAGRHRRARCLLSLSHFLSPSPSLPLSPSLSLSRARALLPRLRNRVGAFCSHKMKIIEDECGLQQRTSGCSVPVHFAHRRKVSLDWFFKKAQDSHFFSTVVLATAKGELRVGHLWREKWTATSGPPEVDHSQECGSSRTSETRSWANAYLLMMVHYRDTSLIRKRLILGPYSRRMPRVLWGS